jgi:aminodeoxyfutalosine deaminase
MARRALHADGVITGDCDVLVDGAVVVEENGTVVDVGQASEVLVRHAGLAIERVRGVVMPGLVNAHVHLELTALRGQVPGGAGFVPWVERLIGARSEAPPEDDGEAIARGVAELLASGTVAVGEVTNSLASVTSLARAGIGGSIFHEVFGLDRTQVLTRIEALEGELRERVAVWPTTDLAYAPSPHTVYTTHRDAVRALVDAGRARGLRMSLHLAEHPAERRALAHADGPVIGWYESRMTPIVFADTLGAVAPDVLLVHLADAQPGELDVVAARGAPVVLCPRSNLYIEMRLPPLLAMREVGIAAALGTDSLASNSSLDVLDEARALFDRFPSIPATELLRMATWNGALALGRRDIGRIARGTRPGIVAIEGIVGRDPARFVMKNVHAKRRFVVTRTLGSSPS